MPQTSHRDLEEGNGTGTVDGYHNQPQPAPNQPFQSSRGEFDYDNSSWPLYSMYAKITQDEDNTMVERCQKDVDGTLVFSGLFSATIATLLSVSIPDLKPNSQDTSAFYLANIYGVLGNPNVSHVIEPPAFSPPSYAIWVNSLWFLSLSFSLAAATTAMLHQSWVLRYVSVVQNPQRTPDKRARVHAVFANDNPGSFILSGSGNESLFLHISVFLFLIGSLIYLFNINHAVFGAVVWFLLIVSMQYVLVTALPIFCPAMLFRSPFTPLTLNLYLGILYTVSQVCSCIEPLRGLSDRMRGRYRVLRDRYCISFASGKEEEAKEIASKPTSLVDAQILRRILYALDDDGSLQRFFDSIPGFCNSKSVNLHLPGWVEDKFRQTLDGFLDHTFTSNFVSGSVRSDRLITCLNAAHAALGLGAVQGILDDIFKGRYNEALQSVETGHSLRRWGNIRDDFDAGIRRIIARIVVHAQERDDSWITLVKDEFGIPDGVLQDNLEHGDSVLLTILIYATRQALHTRCPQPRLERDVLQSLSKFDIHNTLPGLQRDFCALWNEIIQEQKHDILDGIRQAYTALHVGTDAAPTRFPAPIDDNGDVRWWPWSYWPCDIANHSSHSIPPLVIASSTHPPPTQHANFPGGSSHQSSVEAQPAASGPSTPQQGEEVSVVSPSADHTPLRASELPQSSPPVDLVHLMGETSQAPALTSLSSPCSDPIPVTNTPGSNSFSVPYPAAPPSHPLESNMQRDIARPYHGAALDITESSSTVNPKS